MTRKEPLQEKARETEYNEAVVYMSFCTVDDYFWA